VKPVVLDLCCGLGGWSQGFVAAGWDCVGVDWEDFGAVFPGSFVRADLVAWSGWTAYRGVCDFVVASPPCQEFSRHAMPWLRRLDPPKPSLELVRRCFEIARGLGVGIVLENVSGAREFLGPPVGRYGPYCLWGDVPCLLPSGSPSVRKSFLSGSQSAVRAKVPFELAYWVARVCRPGGGETSRAAGARSAAARDA